VDTLRELIVSREKGEVRRFDRVIIESTGLADPAPVIQALMTFPVSQRFRLHQVVTAVDAVNGARTLRKHPEAVKQVAVADEIIITKTDIDVEAVDQIASELKRLNPGARLHLSSPQKMPVPSDLATFDVYDPFTKTPDVVRWLQAEFRTQSDDGGHDEKHHHHQHDTSRHSAEIASFVLEFDKPIEWEHVANWLDALVLGHGNDLLRVKGILDIVGRRQPIVVQAVQSLFHPPFELPVWPEGLRKSRIVFITRNISRAFVLEVLATIQQRASSNGSTA
jgi:G3E family GTPase